MPGKSTLARAIFGATWLTFEKFTNPWRINCSPDTGILSFPFESLLAFLPSNMLQCVTGEVVPPLTAVPAL
jgi:hypothetical protein